MGTPRRQGLCSHIDLSAGVVGTVCGPHLVDLGALLRDSKSGVKVEIVNTKVARRASPPPLDSAEGCLELLRRGPQADYVTVHCPLTARLQMMGATQMTTCPTLSTIQDLTCVDTGPWMPRNNIAVPLRVGPAGAKGAVVGLAGPQTAVVCSSVLLVNYVTAPTFPV